MVRVGVDAPDDELEMFRFDGRSEADCELLCSRPESYEDREEDEKRDESPLVLLVFLLHLTQPFRWRKERLVLFV